jgi:hypothetical protein
MIRIHTHRIALDKLTVKGNSINDTVEETVVIFFL